MAFSPEDISNHQFAKTLKGFDPLEVKSYLEVLTDKFSDILEKNGELAEKVETYEKNFKEFDFVKAKWRKEQIDAQEGLKMLKTNAEKEARIILMDAKIKAENITNEAFKKIDKLRQEIEELSQLKESFTTRFKKILRHQLETIELYSKENIKK